MTDWSRHDAFPEDRCECRCGTFFGSHARFVNDPRPHIESRKPCPACGQHELRAARSGPSTMEIGPGDVAIFRPGKDKT